MLVLGDGELVHREPVVVVWNIEIDHSRLRAGYGAIPAPMLDRHCHPRANGGRFGCVTSGVAPSGSHEFAKGIVERLGRQRRVQPAERMAQASLQNDLRVVAALSG